MTPENRKKISSTIDSILVFIWGVTILLFPFVISSVNTEAFVLPKEIFISAVVLISLLLFGAKVVVTKRVVFRRTPLDVPIALFAFALILSSVLAVNRFDSLIATTPVFLMILGYFLLVNVLRKQNTTVFAFSAFVISGVGVSVIAIFSFLKVYPIPLTFTHVPSFTTMGSLLEQIVFLAAVLAVAIQLGLPLIKGNTESKTVAFAAAALFIGAGILVTIAQLLTSQKPLLLPFDTGFQTAFAAISQDTGRILQGFLFGSGYGNYTTVFDRFRQSTFNSSPYWYIEFNQSSSFILELLATTGIVGILSFFLILFRALVKPSKKKINPAFFALVILGIATFVLPFSFEGVAVLFLTLALFSSAEAIKHPSQFFDIEPRLVALKKGLIALEQTTMTTNERYEYSNIIPFTLGGIILVFVAFVGWYAGHYVISDVWFQDSIVAANSNNGSLTYKSQVNALNTFPYQSSYNRIFAQTNIALANSIANSQQKSSSPSAQVQSTVYALIQQGITSAKSATSLAPLTVANWQNLSSVYRALIGIGQGADGFAIQAAQQATILDPSNPQEYISLGGIYYQLGQYDNAIRVFQQAVTLKQDYANAYYNLGHAYLQKNDTTNGLAALQLAKQLVANDPNNLKKVTDEINSLQNQQSPTGSPTPAPTQTSQTSQGPLNVEGQTTPIQAQTSPIPLAPTATPTPGK